MSAAASRKLLGRNRDRHALDIGAVSVCCLECESHDGLRVFLRIECLESERHHHRHVARDQPVEPLGDVLKPRHVAAAAARENLELVEDAYARGAASLLDLLDAQTAELNAEEQAANALYDFLDDWLQLHRAASLFDLVLDSEKQEAFADRLDAYFSSAGIELSQ